VFDAKGEGILLLGVRTSRKEYGIEDDALALTVGVSLSCFGQHLKNLK
jgi:hypothetical protein